MFFRQAYASQMNFRQHYGIKSKKSLNDKGHILGILNF